MSVPKDKREEGELTINSEARGLCKHLLQILGNEKNFPKEQEWFTNRMRETALDIDLKCWKANNIYVDKSEELYAKRLGLESEAGDECTEMLELLNVAKGLYHMPSKRYYGLTDQFVDLRKHIRNWYKSDRERLKP